MKRQPRAVCTAGLIIINVLVFLILSLFGDTESGYFMLRYGAMYEPLVTDGHEYYRIIASLFLHFGIQHLLNNMVLLGALGYQLENEVGKIRFLLIYFFSGICGNLCSLYWNVSHGQQVISAGASGAIFGLMGALLYIVAVNRGRLGSLSGRGVLFMVILSLYFGFASSGVDNSAHVGGLIFGIVIAILLYRRKNKDCSQRGFNGQWRV